MGDFSTTENRSTTLEQLAQAYPREPVQASTDKETPRINSAYKTLIEATPFFTIASRSEKGLDCSPRGDGPNDSSSLLQVLDDRFVGFADRRGNNRLDTLRNIIHDPHVGLLCLIPGVDMTLRLNGQAHISRDPALLARFVMKGIEPASVIVIRVDTVFFQCARAVMRAGLWNSDRQVDPKSLPSAGDLLNSVINDFDGNGYDAALPERQASTLY